MPNYTLIKKKYKSFKESKNRKRFFTAYDMAEAKRSESIYNSMVKRGDVDKKHTDIAVCGCGSEGCFIIHSVQAPDIKRDIKEIITMTTEELQEVLSNMESMRKEHFTEQKIKFLLK